MSANIFRMREKIPAFFCPVAPFTWLSGAAVLISALRSMTETELTSVFSGEVSDSGAAAASSEKSRVFSPVFSFHF